MMLQDYDLGLSPAASQCQSSYKHITSLGQYRGLAGFMSPTVHGRRQEFVGGHSRILREFCGGSTFPTTSEQNPNKIPTQLQLNPTFRARGEGKLFFHNWLSLWALVFALWLCPKSWAEGFRVQGYYCWGASLHGIPSLFCLCKSRS